MFKDALEIGGEIADERIERFKSQVLLIRIQEFCAPEFLITEKIVLYRTTACKREPLHVVSHPDVVVRWIIDAGMSGSSGNDGRQMRRKFLRGRPLIETRIRSAPHRDLAVTERLLGQPLDQVVSVAWFVCERLEFAAGIPSAREHRRARTCNHARRS